jgi:hypothetical protein
MHDPKTVAHEIRSPFKNKHGYRPSIITIWHVDPQNFKFPDGTQKQGGRSDDSCGWFTPMHHISEWESIKKLATQQYGQIFEKQIRTAEGKDYAYICNAPESAYEIIYWIWRAIKAHNKKGWQYGHKDNFLSAAELEQIMTLSTNPVDNLRYRAQQVKNVDGFIELFSGVWNNYRRFHRPWYKHPRWHIHHWQIQFHPFQDLKRRYWDKCAVCGKRGFKGSAMGSWDGDRIWHQECDTSRTAVTPKQQDHA